MPKASRGETLSPKMLKIFAGNAKFAAFSPALNKF